MLHCKLRKYGEQGLCQLGQVSHCLHGYVDAIGLRALRMDLLLLLRGDDARCVHRIMADTTFPTVGDHLDLLQLRHSETHITHQLATTALAAGGAGGWSLTVFGAFPLAVETAAQVWCKGLWLNIAFLPQADAGGKHPPFQVAGNAQANPAGGEPGAGPEATLHPSQPRSDLMANECLHGMAMMSDGGSWEFLRDYEGRSLLGERRVDRYEKDRSQSNSLLHAAFAIGEACRTKTQGAMTITLSEPVSAAHENTRKITAQAERVQKQVAFSYGANQGNTLVRLHFQEYGGRLRGKLQLPPLAAYADGTHALYTQPDFWLGQLPNVLAEEAGDEEDQGIPREVITIVRT
jgi:hypothetical protein